MKTSKKLLSLFLAVVMVITTCSVGFTAFAADSSSNSTYWNGKTDEKAAFAAINALIDNYIPALLNNDTIKPLLENTLGMKVDSNTSISDVVEGASPFLMKTLSSSGNKEQIITEYYEKDCGYSKSDAERMYKNYSAFGLYDYLDDETADMNFYALYQFCVDNENSDDKDIKAYAKDTLPKLKELLHKHLDAFDSVFSENNGDDVTGTAALANYKATVEAGGLNVSTATLSQLENFDVSGTPLKDVHKTDKSCDTKIAYDNMYLDFEGCPIKIDNIAAALYYQAHPEYVEAIFYLYLANLGGATIEYGGTKLTPANCMEVIGGSEAECLETVYNTIFDGSTVASTIDPSNEFASPYYSEIAIGAIEASKSYDTTKYSSAIEFVNAQKVSDDQIKNLYDHVVNNGGTFGDYISDANAENCAFSEYARQFLSDFLSPSDYILSSIDINLQNCANENDAIEVFRKFALSYEFDDFYTSDGDDIMLYYIDSVYPADDSTPFNTITDFMIPSVIIQKLAGKTDAAFGFPGTANVKFFYEDGNKGKLVKDALGSVKYNYSDVKVPDSISVSVVNSVINGYLNYLKPGTTIGDGISGVLDTLLTTEGVDLYSTLTDVWMGLYKDPVEEIFTLLPVVTILLDEVVIPMVFNDKGPDTSMLYSLLVENDDIGFLKQFSQASGNTAVGIGNLAFDLNNVVPSILYWITGDKAAATALVGTYDEYASGVDTTVPRFTNIYAADKAIAGFDLNGDLASLIASKLSGTSESNIALAYAIEEAVKEIVTFLLDAVNEYLDKNGNDKRYDATGAVAQVGLNNIFVALPEILDIVGKNYVKKYDVNSDWDLKTHKITLGMDKSKSNTQKYNTVLESFKAQKDPSLALYKFSEILICEWINPIIDIVNDTIADPNNKITSNIPLVQALLESLGGFGEKSLITDVLNGFFQLKRTDAASFTLEKRNNGFVGFSADSGIFLLSNLFVNSGGEARGLIPFITTVIKGNATSASASTSTLTAVAPLLANSSKVNKSSVGTDYSELLKPENTEAADKLVKTLDKILSSLLENTTVNGFTLDQTDNILSAVATVASSYLGSSNTNDLVLLLNNYFYYIVGETKNNPGAYGKIGTLPKDGKVDEKKVYTSANLSNLVIQTYSLVENIVDYLFYNEKSGLLNGRDPNKLIADAVCGIISPDAVAVRMSSKYSKTKEILEDNGKNKFTQVIDYKQRRLNWNSFKVEISEANAKEGSYTKDYLKFGFSDGNKKEFYNALGESLSGIAGIVGALLAASYAEAPSKAGSENTTFYATIVYPIFSSVNTALRASGKVMTVDEFMKASPSEQLINGVIAPISAALDTFYKAPATFLLNFIKGVANVLTDAKLTSIINGALNPVVYHLKGVVNIAYLVSPQLAGLLAEVFKDKLSLDVTKADATFNINLPQKDIAVTLVNKLLASLLKKDDSFQLIKSINWQKLATAATPGETLLLIYAFVVDTILNIDFIRNIIDSLAPGLTDILNNISATQLLDILNAILEAAQSPTEVYWTFAEYAGKLSDKFVYPAGITASGAREAVDQLDSLVQNVFPLLSALGVTDIEGLDSLINDKLYTNEILTSLAKAMYGALSKGTVGTIIGAVGIDATPSGFAKYLTDKKYGKTFSSAAKTLQKTKNWDKVKTLNWGFTNGSSKAQAGFINGLAAILRPFNDILAVFLAEGKLDLSELDLEAVINELSIKGSTNYASGEYGGTLEYKIKNGTLTLTVRSNAKVASGKPVARNVIKVDLAEIVGTVTDMFTELNFGTNGYESAVIPVLEAFMCKNVKTYNQYRRDYKKAKDNLLIDVLTPVLGLVKDIAQKPFDTLTKILPNVAYFIDNNGVVQVISNLLAPITSEDGIIGILSQNGFDIDEFIEELTGKNLGKIVADAIGAKKLDLNIELGNLAASNIQDMIIPLVNSILKKNNLGIKIPDIDFAKLASYGTIKTVKSAAMNDEGKYTTRRITANQGEVLVAVFRYIADLLVKNSLAIKDIVLNIDAIKNNETIANIVASILNHLATAGKDDIIRAIFFFLNENATDRFFDYRNFKYKDGYEFSFGNMDEDFCRQLGPMLDGLVGGLLEGGLGGLVESKLYTDDLVAKLATGLYGAIEGVKIGDGNLTGLLAMTDIDFSTSNVASLLTNSKYGLTYPAAANVISSAGSWGNVKAEDLKFGVSDRASFLNAVVAVLRPIFGVVDVLLNDASLNLFNLIKIPGTDGYTSVIVPLFEAFGVYNIKTQYQYREDCYEAYDNVLLDIINPLWDKVEDLLNAPVEILADILPNLSLFFANDGLLQIVENLFAPISALLEALKPIVDVNEVLTAAGLDIPKLLKDKVGLNVKKFDIYDLSGTLKPLVGADNVVKTINSVLGIIKIKGTPLGIELPDIDWFKLASHGEFVPNATSQAATYGGRIAVIADQDETLIAVLRFLIDTINYKGNYDAIVNLITGILGDSVSDSISDVISQVLGMLKGDSDEVIEQLVDLLKQFA